MPSHQPKRFKKKPLEEERDFVQEYQSASMQKQNILLSQYLDYNIRFFRKYWNKIYHIEEEEYWAMVLHSIHDGFKNYDLAKKSRAYPLYIIVNELKQKITKAIIDAPYFLNHVTQNYIAFEKAIRTIFNPNIPTYFTEEDILRFRKKVSHKNLSKVSDQWLQKSLQEFHANRMQLSLQDINPIYNTPRIYGIPDKKNLQPEQNYSQQYENPYDDLIGQLQDLVRRKKISQRDVSIVLLRYGIGTEYGEPEIFTDLGKRFSITQSRAKQVYDDTIRIIQKEATCTL